MKSPKLVQQLFLAKYIIAAIKLMKFYSSYY